MEAAAICKHVSRIYNPGEFEVRALDDVSLTINKGEMAAIVGPSGSGKSTLLNVIGCLDNATAGTILVGGEKVSTSSRSQLASIRRKKIGFIFQSFHLIPVFTAYENVEFALQIQGGYTAEERKARILPLLDSLGIAHLADRRPGKMSGGQQQRVAIARALVKKPTLVLADEPTANLDSKTSQDIIDLMVKLNQEDNVTFILSTHDPKLMEAIPRVITLVDGQVVDDTTKEPHDAS